MDYRLSEDWSLGADLLFDHVSSASIKRLGDRSAYPNTQQSGASGDFFAGATLRARRHLDEGRSWGGLLGVSGEYDYTSLSFGGDYSWEREDRNASFTVGLGGFYDTVKIIRWDGTQTEGNDQRFSLSTNLAWYQAIDGRTHGTLGLTHTQQSGFLETPYNAITLEDGTNPPNPNLEDDALGVEATEELPGQRGRDALFGRLRRYLGADTSLELGGRYYLDDWGIGAWSLEPRLYHQLVDDRLGLRLRYRYYTQTPADYWAEHFAGTDPADAPTFRTQDPELGEFDSHTVGAQLSFKNDGAWGFDVSMDVIMRSDDLDHVLLTFGWNRRF
jgi:hypothetical protein